MGIASDLPDDELPGDSPEERIRKANARNDTANAPPPLPDLTDEAILAGYMSKLDQARTSQGRASTFLSGDAETYLGDPWFARRQSSVQAKKVNGQWVAPAPADYYRRGG